MLKSFILAFFIILISCSKSRVELLTNLDEIDANDVVANLIAHGVDAKKISLKDGISVEINENDMSRSVSILKASGLPNKKRANMGEIFKKEGMISTPLEERARYIYALSQELEFTLSQIDKVLTARVHIVLPERIAPGQPIQPSSAAIFIKHLPELDPDVIENKIVRMVSSSIPGLSASKNKISITFIVSHFKPPDINWDKFGPFIMTQESIKDFKKILTYVSVFLVFIVLIVLIFFIKKHIKR